MTATRQLNAAQSKLMRFYKSRTPLFLWGSPGIGKSAMVAEVADMCGVKLIDIRLSMRESVDLRGLPMADRDAMVTRWLTPDELPNEKRDGKEGILFFDEVNAGVSQSTLVACYQIFHDRKLGDWSLPDGWRLFGAGNKLTDRAAAMKLPSALNNRAGHHDVEVDIDAWCDWAMLNGIDPMIVAFIRFRNELLFKMPDGAREFCSPRSWTMANRFMDEPRHDRLADIASLVGDGPAGELEAFIDVAAELEPIAKILANPKTAKVPPMERIAALYAVTIGVAYAVDKRTVRAGCEYAMRLPADFRAMFAKAVLTRDPALAAHGMTGLLPKV